jgi:hypothetical protein
VGATAKTVAAANAAADVLTDSFEGMGGTLLFDLTNAASVTEPPARQENMKPKP